VPDLRSASHWHIGVGVSHGWASRVSIFRVRCERRDFHERKSSGILIVDMGNQSPHPFDFAQGTRRTVCAGRTLLSVAFDFEFDCELGASRSGIKTKSRIKVNGDGQECPSHILSLTSFLAH
jgi:hypothetical protein